MRAEVLEMAVTESRPGISSGVREQTKKKWAFLHVIFDVDFSGQINKV